jgi:hypothetical protein
MDDRILVGAEAKKSGNVRSSAFLPSGYNLRSTDGSRRISRLLAISIFIGGSMARLVSKSVAFLSSAPIKEKEYLMSSPAKAEDNQKSNGGNGHPKTPLLETLLDQDRSVTSNTDDLLDQARTHTAADFSRTFEKRVGGLSGFGAPLVRPSHK